MEKKNVTWSFNDSSPIPPIGTPSSCHTSSPSQQGTKAPSQPQGHETPPQQGQGQQTEFGARFSEIES